MPAVKTRKSRRLRRPREQAVPDCLVAFILDMSGSMSDLVPEVIEGVNGYVEQLREAQKKEGGKILFSLTAFDTAFESWYVCEEIAKVSPLTTERYRPRGLTALYDAIANTLTDSEIVLRRMIRQKRVGEDTRVLVVVLTDGYENASQEYAERRDGKLRLSTLIDRFEKQGWTFTYLGAHVTQDRAEKVAEPLGFTTGNIINWVPSPAGMTNTADALAKATVSYYVWTYSPTQTFFADAGQSSLNYTEDAPDV